jgi:ABC-2 type transport system permease protein
MRTVLIMLLALPLLLIFLLGNALESDIKPVKLSIYTEDGGQLEAAAESYLASPGVRQYVEPRIRGKEEEVRQDLVSGKAEYGFALTSGAARYYPGQFSERNLIAESVLNRFTQEIQLRQSAAAVLPSLTADAADRILSGEAGRELVRIGSLLSREETDFNSFSALQYYSVAYLIMFLMYSGMSVALSLNEARENGTLLRLNAMPVSANVLLLGKLMGAAFFSFLQAAIIIGFTRGVYGVDWGDDYGGIAVVCALVSLSTVCFSVIMASFLRSRRAIESVFSFVITLMTFLSGGMITDLGPTIRKVGQFTLNHWANEAIRHLMAGGALQGVWQAIAVLAAILTVLMAAAMLRFKKAVALT